MTHLEKELKALKGETVEMWQLVLSQLQKASHSLQSFDKDFAHEVIANEKRVNSMELKIDRDCESIFALYTPVAVDLRLVLATLKIVNNLERIGDIAEGIANFILSEKKPFDKSLLKSTRFNEMFDGAVKTVGDVLKAFEEEDTKLARSIFQQDEILDEINLDANKHICIFIGEHLPKTEQALNILSIIRRLERVGDQSKNIAEEIIFYVEAKVLKHNK